MAANTPDTPDTPPKKHRRLRRRFILLLLPVLLFAGLWKAAELYIDIERFRPVIDEELELLIELPLTFGAMDLQLLPTPRLVVENVALGEEDFMAFAPRVTVTASLTRLFRKQLALHVVEIHHLRVQLPVETPALQERWSAYMLALDTPSPSTGKPMLEVTLDHIEADGVQVMRGESHYASGDLRVDEVTTDAPRFTFDARGDAINGTPAAQGEFTLTVDREPLLQGSATVAHLPLANLTGDSEVPPFLLDGTIQYRQAQDDALAFEATGTIGLDSDTAPFGTFSLAARYAAGDLRFDRLQIDSTPLTARATLQILPDYRWTLAVETALLRDGGITWLADRFPEIPFADDDAAPSEGVLAAVRMGEDGSGFTFVEGAVDVRGVGLTAGGGFVFPEVDGHIAVAGGTFQVTELTSRHLRASGTVQPDYAAGTVALDLTGELRLAEDFPVPGTRSSRVRADAGVIEVQRLKAVFDSVGLQMPTVHAQAGIRGLIVSVRDGESQAYLPIPELHGALTVEQGVMNLTELKGADSVLSGTIAPDAALERWTFAGQFTSDLASAIWNPLIPGTALSVTGGAVECTRLNGVFTPDSSLPENLDVAVSIRNLAAGVDAGGFNDQLAFESVNIAITSERLSASLSGTSTVFGPVQAEGRLAFDSGDVEADTTLLPAEAPGIPASFREGSAGMLLAQPTPMPLHLRYEKASNKLMFSAETPVSVSGTLGFKTDPAAKAPFSLTATASLPVAAIAPQLLMANASGNVGLDVSLSPGDGRLNIHADMADAQFGWSVLRKPAGFPMAVELDGAWGTGGSLFNSGKVASGGQTVPFEIRDGDVHMKDFTVDLAPFTPWLPDGSQLAGALGARVAGDSGTLALQFDSTSATLGAGGPTLSLDGAAERNGEDWTIEGLKVALDESAGVVKASRSGGNWQGEFQANRIDIDGLARAYDVYTAVSRERNPDQLEVSPAPVDTPDVEGPGGTLQVSAAQLDWFEASMAEARCTVDWTASGIQLNEIAFAYGTGKGTGRVAYRYGAGTAPGLVDAEVQLAQVDARLLEGLFMEKARGLEGLLDGRAALSFPTGQPSVLHGMNGTIEFTGADGTLGKAGLATKLLTALRATEVLRLRFPELRDRGLTFEAIHGTIAIENGVFRLDPFAMADSSYALEGVAAFDFPQDLADGDLEVQLLEGVAGVARKIPLLGEAASIVSKVLGVPVKIVGKASDPTFRVGIPG